MTSSNTDEHYTPQEVIEAAIACLGEIDLDPCSNEPTDGRPNVPAALHFTQEDDGLAQNWVALTLYMNPPYSDVKRWISKLIDEYESGHVQQAIALVKADPSTRWFQRIWEAAEVVCFVDHRLRFHGTVKTALQQHLLARSLISAQSPNAFVMRLSRLGQLSEFTEKKKRLQHRSRSYEKNSTSE